MIYLVAAVAGLAGFLFGFDEGIIAGALGLLRNQFAVSPFMEGLVTSAVPFGALFGALVGGQLAASLGRRNSLLLAGAIFVVGALIAGSAGGVWMLAGARLVIGFAIGLAAIVAPLYISENAPASHRGMLVSIYQLAITLGIVGAYFAGYVFSDSWRTMFFLGAVPGLALIIGMAFMTDTPRWLVSRGRLAEAQGVIAKVRGVPASDPAVRTEIADIQRASEHAEDQGSWSDLARPYVRPALVVGMGLFVLQQVSGINAVIYYAPTVFQEAGFSGHSVQLLATLGVGIVNVLMTFVGMALIDRVGRRKLLYLGFAGTALGLGMIAVGAFTHAAWLDTLSLIGLIVFIGSFAASIGPLPWVMMSEIFPLSVRARGMSLASLANWAMNFVIVFSFPALLASLGLGGVFAIYAAACVLGLLFTYLYVPETSHVTLEAIEQHLRSGRPFRDLGRPPAAMAAPTVLPQA